MSISDLIQFGMLLVAVLALVASFARFILGKIRARYFGIKVRLDFPDRPCVYIREECYRRGACPIVRTVAIWTKITVTNLLDEVLVLDQILACVKGASPRSMIDPPVRTLDIDREQTVVANHLELPMRLEGHSPMTMWLLLDIPVPEPIGEAIYKVDPEKAKFMCWEGVFAMMDVIGGPAMSTSEIRQILVKYPDRAERADEVLEQLLNFLQRHLLEDMKDGGWRGLERQLGIKVIPSGFRLGDFSMTYPLINVSDGKAAFTGDRHRLRVTSSDLANYLSDKAPALLNSNPCTEYVIRILFSNGRVISQKIHTGSDALWFQHPQGR